MRNLITAIICLLLATPILAQTATPVKFPKGQNRTMVAGKVPAMAMQVFTLEAKANKHLELYLMSAASNARFELVGPDGEVLGTGKPDKFGVQIWKGKLKETGLHTVVVFSSKGLADFQLTLSKS